MPLPRIDYSSMTDHELLGLVKEDDFKAYETVYQRHWPRLFETAYKKLSSRQKAEDILQELFISLYKRRLEIDITVSLSSYLNSALKYKILNEYRSNAVRSAFQKQSFFGPDCKNDLADSVESKELSSRLETVLANLPAKCRQAFVFSRDANLSNKEIAHQMQISVSTVEKHIVKALKILRDSVRQYQLS